MSKAICLQAHPSFRPNTTLALEPELRELAVEGLGWETESVESEFPAVSWGKALVKDKR